MVADFATVLGFICLFTIKLLNCLPASTSPSYKNELWSMFHSFFHFQRSPRWAWILA